MADAPRRPRVVDLTGQRRRLVSAVSTWLIRAALATAGSPPPLPEELRDIRSPDRLRLLSALRREVVHALSAEGPNTADVDRLWDLLVWQLAAQAESEVRDELEQLVRTDPLTGLLNRRGLDEALERETARSRRTDRPLALAVVDVDRFKALNDTWGHQTGDDALSALGELLRRGVRAGDVAGRWGGDEFAVVLVDVVADQALDVVDRIRATLTHPSFRGTLPRGISFSAGIASAAGAAADTELLVRAADAALYAAKAEGGNRTRVYREPGETPSGAWPGSP